MLSSRKFKKDIKKVPLKDEDRILDMMKNPMSILTNTRTKGQGPRNISGLSLRRPQIISLPRMASI